jgi:hypothetical protein
MTLKPRLLRILSAMFICFVILSAFRPGDMRKPPENELPDAATRLGELPQHPLSPFEAALLNPRSFRPLSPSLIDSETVWLARAVFSETKRPEEQILVAWVIRNRVETTFRGKNTYRDVVLDPYQFSAFMTNSADREYYLSLDATSKDPGWQRTLYIAYNIRHLNGDYRPFSERTRHFYSERSMKDNDRPTWVEGRIPLDIAPILDIDQTRFRFYEGIS